MNLDDFLRQAQSDCSWCGGTGIIEGADHLIETMDGTLSTVTDPDRICVCVPTLIIRAP